MSEKTRGHGLENTDLHSSGGRTLSRVSPEVLGTIGTSGTTRVRRNASPHIVWGRRCRTIRGAYSGIVLGPTPGEANPRIANGVSLHLVDGHLSRMTMDELNKAAALARGDLNVGDLAEALEERTKFIFGDVARETTHKDGGVVRIGELIHGLHGVVRRLVEKLGHTPANSRSVALNRWRHLVAVMTMAVLVRSSIMSAFYPPKMCTR